MTLSPSLLIALPLTAAAILIALLDRIPRRVTEWIAIAVAAVTLAGTIVMLLEVLQRGTVVVWIGGWHPGNRVGLGVDLAIDLAAASVGIVVAAVVLCATVFSYEYFEEVGTIFYVLILAMLGAMIAFAYAGDLFDMFVWYEVFSVGAYALTTYRGDSPNAYRGALQFALTNSVAGLFFLLGITLLEGRTGELNLVAIGHSLAAAPRADALVTTAFACIAVGLFTRGALAPLHFWFDEVHAAAPAPLSAILSGAMVPLALYGFARIYWASFASVLPRSWQLETIVMGIGCLSALYGTAMALRESRFKRKLAHVTVAHSGVALAAIGTFTARSLAGAAAYEAGYAAAAATLFFTIAILRSRTGEHDVKRLTGAGRTLPITGIAFATATVVLGGLWNATRAIGDSGSPGSGAVLTAVAIVVAGGTGGAFAAAFVRIFLVRPVGVTIEKSGLPWFFIMPTVALAAVGTALAVVPAALVLAARSASQVVAPGVYAGAVMRGIDRAAIAPLVPHAPVVSWAAPVLMCVVAFGSVSPERFVRIARIALSRNAIYRTFVALDDGDSGIYIAWVAGSAAALSLALSFTLI